jgi:hypothetical protein
MEGGAVPLTCLMSPPTKEDTLMPRVGCRAVTADSGPIAAEPTEGCTDPSAVLDLAALSESTLSPQGMHRLAGHVIRCPTCQRVLAALIRDTHAVDSTVKRSCDSDRLLGVWAAGESGDTSSRIAASDK